MSEPIDLRLLRALVEVQRTGSITAAAAAMRLSQPAVTAQVQALEGRLGRTLFVRESRGMVPTPLADMLAAEAAPHVDALQTMVSGDLPDRTTSLAGRVVNIGGPAEIVSARVIPSLAPLVAEGLRVRVVLGQPPQLMAGLTDGGLDMAVLTVRPRQRGVLTSPLCDEELVLVAGPDRAMALSAAIEHADMARAAALLGAQPLVAYAEAMPLLLRYWRTVFEARPPGRPALVVPDLRGVLEAVIADIGISVVPHYLCASAIERGEVRPVLDLEVPPINTLFLALSSGRHTERHLATVQAHLLAQAKEW